MSSRASRAFDVNRKAAYFMSSDTFLGRPFDDGVISSLIDAGYSVDIYAPERGGDRSVYGGDVRLCPIAYRLEWLAKNLLKRSWRQYDLFLGNTDLPMAFAGLLAAVARRKAVTVCDEIYLGEYVGEARRYWKALAHLGMRRSEFTVITDHCRDELQRQCAGLPDAHSFIAYPSCFRDRRYIGSRDEWRGKLGVDADTVLLSFSGYTTDSTGVHWAIRAIDKLPGNYRLLLQSGPQSEAFNSLIEHAAARGRIVHVAGREASYVKATSINLACDIGLVFYLSPAPAFQVIGVSSTKLCMYLQMGLPVVVSRQGRFDFIEECGAGVVIDHADQLPQAVETIMASYPRYAQGARRCYDEQVRPDERASELTARFAGL